MMASEAEAEGALDPADRGASGRRLPPVDPPGPGEPPSRDWLAQIGRAPSGAYLNGRPVLKRLTEDGLPVPGNDPLYQHLGVHRLFAEVLQAQHDEQLSRTRAMLAEARESLAQLLADVGASGGAAVVARRAEDEAALKSFSAEVDRRLGEGVRTLREALAEERNLTTAAVAVAVAEALAKASVEKPPAGPSRAGWRTFGSLGSSWGPRRRSAAAWAALLAASVLAGMALLWVFGHLGAALGGR